VGVLNPWPTTTKVPLSIPIRRTRKLADRSREVRKGRKQEARDKLEPLPVDAADRP
jgi:hypothetical protein